MFYGCVEGCNEAIMITDTAGRLIYVNPAWIHIYGYSSEEALSGTPAMIHSGYHDREFYEKMWSSINNPQLGHWKGEVINRSKSGTMIPVLLTIAPVKDFLNNIVGHMGIALDISTQKQLEAKLLQQDRLASIGVLSSGLAHEVGTPLGVVRGRAEYLMMQPETKVNAILASSLQTIISQIDRISRLIHSLLRYSRATDDVRCYDLELKPVVDEVIALLGQNLKTNAVTLKVEIPEGLRLYADFNRLQQILLNLMVNAIQAIQEVKKQNSAETKERDYEIKISAAPVASSQRGIVRISVSDSGCGIPPENIRKLFQPFFTTKDVGQGTGLGLAIVSKIAQEMNGEVQVESVNRVGAVFSVLLPATGPQGKGPG